MEISAKPAIMIVANVMEIKQLTVYPVKVHCSFILIKLVNPPVHLIISKNSLLMSTHVAINVLLVIPVAAHVMVQIVYLAYLAKLVHF